jgi:hypothetical protein
VWKEGDWEIGDLESENGNSVRDTIHSRSDLMNSLVTDEGEDQRYGEGEYIRK